MDEEVTPTEPTETLSLDYFSPSGDISDNRTLMGTVLQTVFGNQEIMIFIVTVMVLVTLLIISTDFMKWRERD